MKGSIGILALLLIIFGIQTITSLRFILEPEDTVVSKGSSVVLNCAVGGNGLPRISWKKDGGLISFVGDTRKSILANGSLHITALVGSRNNRPEEGTYQCVATLDGVGSIVSRFAKVQSASLTRFIAEPEDLTTSLGHTARFECLAQGVPTPKVSWFKDNEPLLLDETRMTVLPSGSLEIRKVKDGDQGGYMCQASNSDKQQSSKMGRLVLNSNSERDTPPGFTMTPKSSTVVAGNNLVLECSAVAHPSPTISWLKDGVTVDLETSDSRYSIIGEGNLKISNVEESDKGTYQCRAQNREDSVDVSATVDVQVPPKVIQSASNVYAYEKEDVDLPCKISGRPQPTVQWYKNGERIIEGDYFQIVQGTNLKILGLVGTDAGMYQCFVTNPAGNVQSAIQLHVLRPGERKPLPRFGMRFDDLPLMDTFPLSFRRTSSSVGQNIPTSPTIPDHDLDQQSPTGGPSAPRELTAVLVSTRFVTLTWKAPLITNGNIIAYAIYYKEIGSDRERVLNTTKGRLEEVNVQGLQPGKRYTFRVVPYNEKGPGISSPEITITTQAEADVPGPPHSLTPVSVTPTSIKVAWSPPEHPNGNIQRYKIFYVEASAKTTGTNVKLIQDEDETEEEGAEIEDYLNPSNNNGGIQGKTINIPEAILDDLKVFTEYYIWVVAWNQNGVGEQSEELRITTLSDVPGDTPHNVTVESASSISLVVRWVPPPLEFRNGIITGYKIKYKQKKKRAETVTTDGNTLFLHLKDLEKGTEYQVKLAAINVNGTGPFTEWITGSTLERDLDETRVPSKPANIHAQASSDSITISWMPPRTQNIMIRGYTIGWGKGIPDIYTKLVEGKRRVLLIEDLEPNSDYVISVRGFNVVGDGEPIYVNERTKSASEEENFGAGTAQLPPPIGLRAIILSSTSAVLYWTDSSLPRTQIPSDNRFYVLRYMPTEQTLAKKNTPKHVNTTQMNTILDDLKPGTQYEFSVKVVKNRVSSEWSLVAINTTFSLALLAPPQDLTVLPYTLPDGTSNVIVNWQPPKATGEDEVKGYVIFYTTKPSLKEWVEESVPEDVLTHKVQGLTPDTNYYFRMAAKYPKGLGLYTDIKSAATPLAKTIYGNGFGGASSGNGFRNRVFDHDIRTHDIILYILIGLSVMLALASISLCIYYRRKGDAASPNKNSLKKQRKPEQLKPPDLWIHHDHMEMKEKGRHIENLISPSSRGSREFTDLEEKVPLNKASTLEKQNMFSSYLGQEGRNTLTGRTIKSQILSDTSGHLSDGTKTYETTASGSSAASSQNNLHTMAQYSATSEYGTQSGGSTLGTLNRRTLSSGGIIGGKMQSFGIPIPPTALGGYTYSNTAPSNKMNIRPHPGGVVGIHPSNDLSAQRSPVKRVSTSQLPMVVGFSKSISPRGDNTTSGENSPIQKCYSTEELSQEISNLEGLMKDLNAITASEFQC